ncbi:MAG: VanZ family protein [Myxococcales bacterium]|nr:VanZ family protein [Myxococcales bacterium]
MKPAARRPTRPAWLFLYLLGVVSATLFPFAIHCEPGGVDSDSLVPYDFLQNIVLFWPLGVALRERSSVTCALLALLLSLGVEAAQFWVLRSPSVWDLVSDTLGAVLGWHVHLTRARPTRELAKLVAHLGAHRLSLLAALGLLAACIASQPLRVGNDFSGWEPMPLVIGNEATRDRPWSGSIAELAVFDRNVASEAARIWDEAGPPAWSEGGPLLWMRFADPPAGRLDGPTGPAPISVDPPGGSGMRRGRSGLSVRDASWPLPEPAASRLHEQLVQSNRLAVFIRATPDDLEATGPARILSFSRDLEDRNFSIAQSGRDVVFRLRTPVTSSNGTRPNARSFRGPLTNSEHRIWATFDGSWSRIEVDGVCAGERWLAVKQGVAPMGETLGAALVAGCGLASLGGTIRRRRASIASRLVTGGLLGMLFVAVLWAIGTWSHMPAIGPFAWGIGTLASALGGYAGVSIDLGREADGTE